MGGRTDFETVLEERLTALVRAEQGRGTDPTGKGGYCVTYKFQQVDVDSVTANHFSKPPGMRGEVLSILRTNVTEDFNGAETIDIGEVGGAADTVVNGALLATALLIGESDRATIVAGATPIIPQTVQEGIMAITSVGTTGRCDFSLTIRWFR
jgi:hypothetical protein